MKIVILSVILLFTHPNLQVFIENFTLLLTVWTRESITINSDFFLLFACLLPNKSGKSHHNIEFKCVCLLGHTSLAVVSQASMCSSNDWCHTNNQRHCIPKITSRNKNSLKLFTILSYLMHITCFSFLGQSFLTESRRLWGWRAFCWGCHLVKLKMTTFKNNYYQKVHEVPIVQDAPVKWKRTSYLKEVWGEYKKYLLSIFLFLRLK